MNPSPTESAATIDDSTWTGDPNTQTDQKSGLGRYRVLAAVAIALAAVLLVWLAVRDNGSSSSDGAAATFVSESQLQDLATSVKHPVFWLGPRDGQSYELSRTPNGAIYVRYLPDGVDAGAKGEYLTVATYPFEGAYAAVEKVAQERGVTPTRLADGGIAEGSGASSKSVHIAYPGVDYQAEVFDPKPGAASQAVKSAQLTALGELSTTPAPQVTATTAASLKALSASLAQPIYWAGERKGSTYELFRNSNGQIFVRYLPAGVKVGAKEPYLTVGTYPDLKAFASVTALAKKPDAVVVKLPRGGLAVIDPAQRENIHIAYPGAKVQIEVFNPSAAAAKRVITSGRLTTVG